LLSVSGFGERKTELYGQGILEALGRFAKGTRATPMPEKRTRPAEDTLRLLAEGRTLEEIARIRGRQLGSVVSLVADLVEKGKLEFQSGWVEIDKQQSIENACARLGVQWLKPLKEALPPEISFEEIRLIVARLRQQQLRESA
jgi:ATP-dependent DNA helicase RecQ